MIPYHYGTAQRSWGRDVAVWSDDGGCASGDDGAAADGRGNGRVGRAPGPRGHPRRRAAAPATARPVDAKRPQQSRAPARPAVCRRTMASRGRRPQTNHSSSTRFARGARPRLTPRCCVGPRFRYARSRLTLWHAPAAAVHNATQHDVPTPWSRVDVTDASVYTDYSALTNGAMRDPATPDRSHVGVLWGGCVLPFPFRVWCARALQVVRTRVAWPPPTTKDAPPCGRGGGGGRDRPRHRCDRIDGLIL